MQNGPFSSYKREEGEDEGIISRGEDEVLPNRFRSFSLFLIVLCFLLHRLPVQVSRRPLLSRGTPRVRPAAPPTCFPVPCVVANRDRHLSAALFAIRSLLFIVVNPCPIEGCTPLFFRLLVTISIYSFVVSSCVVYTHSLCCRAVSLCDPRSCVIGSSVLCNRISLSLSPPSLALRFKTPVVPPPFNMH